MPEIKVIYATIILSNDNLNILLSKNIDVQVYIYNSTSYQPAKETLLFSME